MYFFTLQKIKRLISFKSRSNETQPYSKKKESFSIMWIMKQCISNLLIRLRFASRENRPTPKNIVRKKKKMRLFQQPQQVVIVIASTNKNNIRKVKRSRDIENRREREREAKGEEENNCYWTLKKQQQKKKNDKTQSKSIQFMIMPKKHQTQPARQSERSASTCQHTRAWAPPRTPPRCRSRCTYDAMRSRTGANTHRDADGRT